MEPDLPMMNDHPLRQYSAWEGNSNGLYSFRDSRQAFGHRFTVEKPDYDWMWTVGGLILAVVAVLVYAAKLS